MTEPCEMTAGSPKAYKTDPESVNIPERITERLFPSVWHGLIHGYISMRTGWTVYNHYGKIIPVISGDVNIAAGSGRILFLPRYRPDEGLPAAAAEARKNPADNGCPAAAACRISRIIRCVNPGMNRSSGFPAVAGILSALSAFRGKKQARSVRFSADFSWLISSFNQSSDSRWTKHAFPRRWPAYSGPSHPPAHEAHREPPDR